MRRADEGLQRRGSSAVIADPIRRGGGRERCYDRR